MIARESAYDLALEHSLIKTFKIENNHVENKQ